MKPEIQPPSSRRGISLKVWGILTAVFLIGCLAGSGGTMMYLKNRLQENFRQALAGGKTSGPGEQMLNRFERNLAKELDLTEAEKAAVRTEMDQTRARLRELRESAATDFTQVTRDSVERVSTALPPGKRKIFREMTRERLKSWGIVEGG